MDQLHDHLLPWWVRVLDVTKLEKIVGLFRRDTRFVPADQRFSNIEAFTLFDAQRRLRRKAYDVDKILDHSLFAIEDLTFNSILIRANKHLKSISAYIDKPLSEELKQSMALSEKQLEDLWDEYSQEYFSRDFITHNLIKVSSIASLMPLYAGCISKERADTLVRKLENDHLFGPIYPVPSVPISSEWFDANRYWQGPSWVNMNWLIINGLERYGYHDHAAALRETTLEMVDRGGFYEYFNPITGKPLGINNFSWTAALTLDLLEK
jgi:glycogen debranching enzyme